MPKAIVIDSAHFHESLCVFLFVSSLRKQTLQQMFLRRRKTIIPSHRYEFLPQGYNSVDWICWYIKTIFDFDYWDYTCEWHITFIYTPQHHLFWLYPLSTLVYVKKQNGFHLSLPSAAQLQSFQLVWNLTTTPASTCRLESKDQGRIFQLMLITPQYLCRCNLWGVARLEPIRQIRSICCNSNDDTFVFIIDSRDWECLSSLQDILWMCFQVEALIKEVQELKEELRSRDKMIAQLTLQCQQLKQHQREQTVSCCEKIYIYMYWHCNYYCSCGRKTIFNTLHL